ncbi:MAG: hypothetical protein QNJ78_11795 [Gammaproteobacteria bacterium]|nr:hypothetical protein [Gammaproteobacteria bacterium]
MDKDECSEKDGKTQPDSTLEKIGIDEPRSNMPDGLDDERLEKPPNIQERGRFRALLASNPNYFGNLKASPYKPVLSIQSNTTYEAIGCVGFQPQFDRLEAVVYINQPSGYGGVICSSGTPEYVRFYMSTDHGASWEDLGLTSFTAFDIPLGTDGAKRLEYAVTLDIDTDKRFCVTENLAQIRAILAWNVTPPPDQPDFIPVWGEVHDTHIQIDPRRIFLAGDLLEAVNIMPVKQLAKVIDLQAPIKAAEPKQLTPLELQDIYKDKGVEPHRFALTEIERFVAKPAFNETLMAPGGKGLLPELEIDWSEIGDLLHPSDGNTRYEALESIGLDTNLDLLVGVIRVKLPSGYSGDLCSTGSREFVTFWADFNGNGTFETCLGATSVNVYDIENMPKEGLEYAVFLPVNLRKYRQPCQDGPVVVRIRAILSWQVAPPCFDPNYVPVWGNRLETLVHIKPGQVDHPGTHYPIIQTAGSMDVGDIDPVSGLANGAAVLAGFTALDSPFGGELIITGHIGNAPDISSGATKLKYRVEVSDNAGVSWQRITNSFTLKRDQLLNGIWSDLPDLLQSVDGEDWYDCQEDLVDGPGNAMIFPVGNVLARWHTGGLSGVWQLRIRVKDPTTPGPVWTSNLVTLKLDNTEPAAAIVITSGGGACADFTIGDVISGTYSATDQHFGNLRLAVSPGLGGSFTSPAPLPAGSSMPLTRSYAGGVPTNGEAGIWSLDTSGMPRCGYVIRLHVWDRTIRNSGFVGHHDSAVVGLCLREPEA